MKEVTKKELLDSLTAAAAALMGVIIITDKITMSAIDKQCLKKVLLDAAYKAIVVINKADKK